MQEIVSVYVSRDSKIIRNFRTSNKHFRAWACTNIRVIAKYILVIHYIKNFVSAI